MADQVIADTNAGDFHFELRKSEDGKFRCLRSDVSAPLLTEEVTDLQDIPRQVFNIFNKLMY